MTMRERRQAILETLCARRHETRENLAFEFGVSKRTIEYDVMELSLTYPIYTTQGNGGGIHVMEGFYLNEPFLQENEVALLERILPTLAGEDKEIVSGMLKKYAFNNR